MPPNRALCRIAYIATDQDPTTRDRRLKDFPAPTMAMAQDRALRWAAGHDRLRTDSDRSRWPWVLERWDPGTRSWQLVSRIG